MPSAISKSPAQGLSPCLMKEDIPHAHSAASGTRGEYSGTRHSLVLKRHRNRKSLGSQITNHTWQPVAPVEGRLPVAPHWALEVKGREASSNTSATIPVQLVSTCIDLPFIKILNLFNDSGLPEEVAMKLVAPYGEFAYPLHMSCKLY